MLSAIAARRRGSGLGFAMPAILLLLAFLSLLAALRPADSAPSGEEIVVADASLPAAWRRLRPAEREVLPLALVEDLPPTELAVALGVSVNAASIRVHRARTKLAALLAD